MSINNERRYKNMVILVTYDLPSVEKEDIKVATKFRSNLVKLGFWMSNESVYYKYVDVTFQKDAIIKKIAMQVPNKGSINIIVLTEKQWDERILLSGQKNYQELKVGNNQYIEYGEYENE